MRAEGQHAGEGDAGLPKVLIAGAGLLLADAAAAQDRAEVDEVMADELAAVFLDQHVDGVDGARVVVVEPGRHHPEAAQLAAVLMGEDIVRVVGTGAVIAERPQVLARQDLAGHGPVAAVRGPGHFIEQLVDVPPVHLALAP